MKQNVGSTDKTFRITVGIIILILGWYFKSWLGLIGLVPIMTAIMGVCPAYAIFGKSTCKVKK